MKDYSFGNFISELRQRNGLSQFQLGTLVGVSNKAVSKWENGSAKPKIATCHKLAYLKTEVRLVWFSLQHPKAFNATINALKTDYKS